MGQVRREESLAGDERSRAAGDVDEVAMCLGRRLVLKVAFETVEVFQPPGVDVEPILARDLAQRSGAGTDNE